MKVKLEIGNWKLAATPKEFRGEARQNSFGVSVFPLYFFGNKFFPLIFILLFISACSKKPIEIPKGLLTREQMVPILTDIHIAQAAIGLNMYNDTVKYNLKDYSEYIFKIHNTSKAQFDSSIVFYTRNPEILSEVYAQVINELSKKQGEVNAMPPNPPKAEN
jgi:hypothetical protein